MLHSLTKSISTITLLLATSSPYAAIMTFDNLINNGGVSSTYTENGITASGVISGHASTGSVHLDDFGTPFDIGADFSMDSLFSAISFDIPGRNNNWNTSYKTDIITAEGYLNGNLVASITFPEAGSSTLTLPTTFTGLDTLSLTLVDYSYLYLGAYPYDDSYCYSDPCNHFNIDNIVLEPVTSLPPPSIAPVPLPAAFPLMVSALAGLSLFRRKKFE